MANIVLVVNNANFSSASTPPMQAIFGSGSGYIPSGNQTGLRGNAVWMTINASSPSSIIPGVLQYKFMIPNDLMQPFTFGEILLVDVGGTVMYAIGVLDQPVVRAADEAVECIMYFDVRGAATTGFGNTHGSATIPAIPFYQAVAVLPPAVQATSIVMVVANPANPGGSILASISYANPSIPNDFTSWSFTDYSLMSFDVVTDVIGNELQLPISPPVNINIATGQFLLQTVNFTVVCTALTPTADGKSVLVPLSNYQVSLMPAGTQYKMYEYSSMNSASASYINRLNVTPDQVNAIAKLGADKVLLSDGSVPMISNLNMGGFTGINAGTPDSADTKSLVNVEFTTTATGLSALAANGIGNELLHVRADMDSLIPKINLLMAWMLAGGSPVDYEHLGPGGNGTNLGIYPTLGEWSISDKSFGGLPFTLTPPTSNSPGTWMFISSDPSIISVSQKIAVIVGVGTVQITAMQNPIQGYLGAALQASCNVIFTGVETFTAPSTVTTDQTFTESISGGYPNSTFSMKVNDTVVLTSALLTGSGAWSQTNSKFVTPGQHTLVVTFDATGNSVTKVITASLPVAPTLGSVSDVTMTVDALNTTVYWPTSNSTGAWSVVSASPAVVTATYSSNTLFVLGGLNTGSVGTSLVTMTQAASPGFLSATKTITVTVTAAAIPVAPTLGPVADVSMMVDGLNVVVYWPTSNSTGAWSVVSADPTIALVPSAAVMANFFLIAGRNAGSVGTTTVTMTQAASPGFLSATKTITVVIDSLVIASVAPTLGPVDDVTMVLGGANAVVSYPTSNSTGAWSVVSSDTVNAGIMVEHPTWFGIANSGASGTYTVTMTQAAATGFLAATKTINVLVTASSTLFMFGANDQGQLGIGSTVDSSSPVQASSFNSWLTASVSSSFSGVLKNGTLWSWGDNSKGQLGIGTILDMSSPVQVGSMTNWAKVVTSSISTAAIKTDGTLWSWGDNTWGQLGIGNTTPMSSPVQVGSLTNWSKLRYSVNNNSNSGLAIKTDGTLWVWGYGSGQLGIGSTTNLSSPVQVGSMTNWSSITTGSAVAGAVKTDGTLWTWGANNGGQLGIGTVGSATNTTSPLQVGTLTNWSKLSYGTAFATAVKTDGTLWAWGYSSYGESGTGVAQVLLSSPTQVGSRTDWLDVACGNFNFLALKTDGTLWSCGLNEKGALGIGTVANASSPVQVGSLTNWKSVFAGNWTVAALQGPTVATVTPTLGAVTNVTAVVGGNNAIVYFPTSNSPGAWTVVVANTAVSSIMVTHETWFALGAQAAGSTTLTMTQAASPGFSAATKTITITNTAAVGGDVAPTLGPVADVTMMVDGLNSIVYWPTSNSTGTWSVVTANQAVAPLTNIGTNLNYFIIFGRNSGSVGVTTVTMTQAAVTGFLAATKTITVTVKDPNATAIPSYNILINDSTTPISMVTTGTFTYAFGDQVATVISGGVPNGKVHLLQTSNLSGYTPSSLDLVLDANGYFTTHVVSTTGNPVATYNVAATFSDASGNNPSTMNFTFNVTARVNPTLLQYSNYGVDYPVNVGATHSFTYAAGHTTTAVFVGGMLNGKVLASVSSGLIMGSPSWNYTLDADGTLLILDPQFNLGAAGTYSVTVSFYDATGTILSPYNIQYTLVVT